MRFLKNRVEPLALLEAYVADEKSGYEGLLDARFGDDGLAEEVGLPKRVGMDFDELVLGFLASLWARMDAFFLQDRSDCRMTNALDALLLQLADDPAVAPLLCGLLALAYSPLSPFVGSRADDAYELEHSLADSVP